MFEYLMPSLVLDEPRGSALASAACAAIHEQIEYARTRDVPWGISESAYAASDHTLAYQYAPQGVPRLALRRTPLDELVVAPYATALAAMFNPHAATANLHKLWNAWVRAAKWVSSKRSTSLPSGRPATAPIRSSIRSWPTIKA